MLPLSARRQRASAADRAACRALLAAGSRSFHAASLLLPGEIREPATALYAFCRVADDAIDSAPAGQAPLAELNERLARIYAGSPAPFAADRAFADVVHDHGIPEELPRALLEGFEWDSVGRAYASIAELNAYGARVAGTVGAMMALVMGARSGAVVARACELGVAMQLTNIARDVGEDAAAGRLYLPRDWLREEGIDPDAWLAQPRFSVPLGRVVARLLAEAEVLYRRAAPGIAALPASCRPAMHAARRIYAQIGREIERHGCDSVSGRACVPGRRKAALLGRAVLDALLPAAGHAGAAIAETGFLVEAAEAAIGATPPAVAGIEGQVAWVLDLFERLERRDRALERAGSARLVAS
jgi:phytoene synthase